jgi:tetraacyldisaccharide 4'-kinase
MGNIILRVWRGEAEFLRALLFLPLGFLSWIYRICLTVRESLFKAGLLRVEKAPIPVVSVGNITVGGTGKTPAVELLSRRLKEQGFSPGIVTLGYKRKREGVFGVNAKKDDATSVGDEALMLARKTGLPVIVGKKRMQAVELGIKEFGIDLALLDDGYQVKDLKKDVEILILNGKKGGHEGDLFPLGPYREPLAMIGKADVILINKGELSNGAKARAAGIPLFRVKYRPTFLYNVKRDLIGPCAFLKEKKVLAFAGLGDNRSFFELLRELGAEVVHEVEFPDHHVYSARDMERLGRFGDAQMLVTTEKDSIKLDRLEIPENLFHLAVEAVVEREDELVELIVKRLGGKDVN